jgi:hypothetical protein
MKPLNFLKLLATGSLASLDKIKRIYYRTDTRFSHTSINNKTTLEPKVNYYCINIIIIHCTQQFIKVIKPQYLEQPPWQPL